MIHCRSSNQEAPKGVEEGDGFSSELMNWLISAVEDRIYVSSPLIRLNDRNGRERQAFRRESLRPLPSGSGGPYLQKKITSALNEGLAQRPIFDQERKGYELKPS